MEVLGSSHVQFEPKELARLERITNEDGLIETEEFMDYAKRSAAVKEFSLRGSRGGGSKHDKAELAFKVEYRGISVFGYNYLCCARLLIETTLAL